MHNSRFFSKEIVDTDSEVSNEGQQEDLRDLSSSESSSSSSGSSDSSSRIIEGSLNDD